MVRSTGSVAGRAAAAIILLGLSGLSVASASCRADAQQPYSDFLKALDAGKVKEVTIEGEAVTWRDQSGNLFETTRPNDPDLVRSLRDHGVTITVVPEHSQNTILYAFINWFPMLLLIGVWMYFISRFRRSKLGQTSNSQDLAAKLDEANAHLARIESILAAGSPGTSSKGESAGPGG